MRASSSKHWQLSALLAGLATLGPFSIDTYLPAFPKIGETLQTSPLHVQQTLSIYLVSYGLMMLWHGPLSDSMGRRPVILVSLFIFLLASLGCAFSATIGQLLIFRGLQGVSAGAGLVVGRAIIRDCFHGADAQRIMSRITMMFAIAPAIAPIIGGWLYRLFGWRSIFIFIGLLTASLILFCWKFLPETLLHEDRQRFHLGTLGQNYQQVFKRREFQLLAAVIAVNFSGFFIYIGAAPVFLLQHLQLQSDQFAWLFLPGVSGIFIGATISGRLAGKVTPYTSINLAYGFLFCAAITNLIISGFFKPSLPWSIIPIMIYTTGMSIAMPSVTLLILDLYPKMRGLVSSSQGFVQTMLSSISAGLIAPWLSKSPLMLALGMASFALAGWIIWRGYLSTYRVSHPS